MIKYTIQIKKLINGVNPSKEDNPYIDKWEDYTYTDDLEDSKETISFYRKKMDQRIFRIKKIIEEIIDY